MILAVVLHPGNKTGIDNPIRSDNHQIRRMNKGLCFVQKTQQETHGINQKQKCTRLFRRQTAKMLRKEHLHRLIKFDLVLFVVKAVPFVFLEHVLDIDSTRAQRLHDLITLCLLDAATGRSGRE